MNTLLSEKLDFEFRKLKAEKVRTYPTFRLEVDFGDSKNKRTEKCPYCGKEIKYKAFRTEFSLKKALILAGLIIVISVFLFSFGFFPYVFGGMELDTAIAFGIVGLFGLIFGIGLLIFQVVRYLAFYTKNKYSYKFIISGGKHLMMDSRRRATWRQIP